jgi:hypothetical protein
VPALAYISSTGEGESSTDRSVLRTPRQRRNSLGRSLYWNPILTGQEKSHLLRDLPGDTRNAVEWEGFTPYDKRLRSTMPSAFAPLFWKCALGLFTARKVTRREEIKESRAPAVCSATESAGFRNTPIPYVRETSPKDGAVLLLFFYLVVVLRCSSN